MEGIDRNNCFTPIRQVLAIAVVVAHGYHLGGFGDDPLNRWTNHQVTMGSLAVLCFFVISGYLIAASAARQEIWKYFVNRLARILPGFWTVQLLTALVLAPLLMLPGPITIDRLATTLGAGPCSPLDYLWQNACLHIQQYTIGSLFQNNVGGSAVNGSLWSLGPEFTSYCYLGLFAIFGGLRKPRLMLALLGCAYVLYATTTLVPSCIALVSDVFVSLGFGTVRGQLFRAVYMAFAAGVVMYRFRDRIPLNVRMLCICAITLVIASYLDAFHLLWPLTLPYIVLFIGHRFTGKWFERYGDFSYGIYIYSFPIQQCLTLWGVNRYGLTTYLGASILLSVLAGFLSWHLIESPAIRLVRRLGRKERQAAGATPALPTAALTPGI